MAPPATKNSSNRTGGGRRSVVPAIPLPYVRRSKPQPTTTPPAINGSALESQANAEPATPETVTLEASSKEEEHVEAQEPVLAVNKQDPTLDAPHNEPTPPITETDAEETVEEASSTTEAIGTQYAQEAEPRHEVKEPESNTAAALHTDGPAGPALSAHPPPAVPTSRYTMPPSFFPVGPHGVRAHNPLANGDIRGPRPGMNGPAHLHHPRPSNGSLQFGGFGSDSSSPAPPHSAGFGLPPGLTAPHDARRQFQGHGHTLSGHAYPHMMPYGTEFVPVTGPDSHGNHQPIPMGAEQQQQPYPANNYGQSTPLSYQGSNSPNHPDDSGAFGHFHHPFHGPNGSHDEHHHHRHQASQSYNGPPPQRMMQGPMPPPHMSHHMQQQLPQDSDLWVSYLQSQFQDTTFADCTVELRYSDDRAAPVQIPGHCLVLARSRPIRTILQSTSLEPSPSGQPSRMVQLVTDDKYLRSDAFWMAVQRLYGFPLLEAPRSDDHMAPAGNLDSRFEFALAYAASGHALEWPSVVIRGITIAAQHLTWNTLETAIEFALTGLDDRASADTRTRFFYGEAVGVLIEAIISFVIHHLTPHFRLDKSVADPDSYARIPLAATKAAPPPTAESHGADDGSVKINHISRSRPTHIKFGDMGESQENGTNDAQASEQHRNEQKILSRVLLNLPFALFQPIFDVAEGRFQYGMALLAEREARRRRAAEAVIQGSVPGAAGIQKLLLSVEPQLRGPWHVLGWHEEVNPYSKDGPSLVRRWQPLMQLSERGRADTPDTTRPSYP